MKNIEEVITQKLYEDSEKITTSDKVKTALHNGIFTPIWFGLTHEMDYKIYDEIGKLCLNPPIFQYKRLSIWNLEYDENRKTV